jgi:hypothetical protein
MPATVKAPQDRKPKKAKATPTGYAFEGADGETYYLPPPTAERLEGLPGRILRDAAMGGEDALLKLMFTCLELSVPEPGVLDALYDLPAPQMMPVLQDWYSKATAGGAPVPS